MGKGTIGEVRDRLWDPSGVPGQVEGPLGKSGTC